MRLLIDTQIFIWAVTESGYLMEQARQIMLDATEIFVSAASIWEIAIKARLGRLKGDPKEFDKITKNLRVSHLIQYTQELTTIRVSENKFFHQF